MAKTITTMVCADDLIADDTVFAMAQALDIAMFCNAQARADYARIYGREWSNCAGVVTEETKSTAPTTTAKTVR